MAEFYVSPTGSDSSSGRSADSAGAFQTIGRAQQAMRASAGADTVHIRGGTYGLNAPLSLTAADAGSSFVAYAGERPVLSGGKAVTGWQVGQDGIWTARLSVSDIRQLVVGGVAQTEARYPNYDASDPIRGGWLWAKAPGQLNSTREMAYDTTKLGAAQVVPGGRVTVFSDQGYSADVLTIASVDTAAGIIRFVGEADYPIGANSRFYVSGGKPQLDRTGEWWFDKTSQTLSFKAPAGFDGSAVAAGGDTTLIQIEGASNITLKGLAFANTTTTAQNNDSSSAAVVITGSNTVTVEGNSFTNVAKGVLIDEGSHHNTLSANSFSDIGSSAVEMGPGTQANLVTNNTISRVGVYFRAASAVSLTESWGNTVSHNRIQDVPRFGVSEINYDPAQKSGGNIYEYNEVLRSGRETPDTGAIYFYSGDDNAHLGSTIRYNHIVDTGGLNTVAGGFVPGADFSWGIYLDDFTSGAQVYGNFVFGTVLGGVNVHGGSNNAVYNNVLLDNAKVGIHVQEIDDRAMPGNVFHHNVVEVPADERVVAADPRFVGPTAFHDNVYYNPHNLTPQLDDYTLAQWRAMEGDRGTEVVTSVGFVDAAAGNYMFAPGSFVLTQGILQLPQNLAGPTKVTVVPPTPPVIPPVQPPAITPIPPPPIQPPAIPPTPPPVVQPPAIPPTPPPVVQPPAIPPAIQPAGTPVKIVQGTSGNDILRAQAGAERLTGGAGADTFVFTSTSKPAVSDVVMDFTTGVDRLQLSRMFFDAAGGSADLQAGSMAAQGEHFVANLTGLATRSQFAQVIYERDTGILRWDPDGASSRPSAIIATFFNAPAVGAGDIFLV